MTRRREPVYAGVELLGRVLLRALDLTVRTAGADRVPARGPVVLAANHVSFPDFVFVGRGLLGRRRVRFMCRHDIWGSRPVGRAMDAMRHVPVDRTAPAHAYLRGRSLLRAGEAVCVFPEGGISAAYVTRALMPGAVALARETGAPLLPVTVWGGQRLWPQKRSLDAPFPRPRLLRHQLVDVVFHEPRTVAPGADLVAATRALGAELWRELEQVQRRAEHRPAAGRRDETYPAHLGGAALERTASYAVDAMPSSAVTPTWGPGAQDPAGPEVAS